MSGVKHDQGKPQISLIPAEAIEGCAAALTFGANKYGKHNFRDGMHYSRLLDACMRHILAYLRNEDLDPESGLSHIHHAMANLAMLEYQTKHHPEMDDRYVKIND